MIFTEYFNLSPKETDPFDVNGVNNLLEGSVFVILNEANGLVKAPFATLHLGLGQSHEVARLFAKGTHWRELVTSNDRLAIVYSTCTGLYN